MEDVPLTRPGRSKRILLFAVVTALSTTALLAIGILLLGDFGEREGRILATTALLAAYGLLALPAGFLFDQRRLRGLAATVLVLAATGFAFAVAAVWTGPPDELGKALATITAFGVASTQTAALAARRREQDPKAVRRLFAASIALALVLAAMVTAAAWGEIVDNSAYYRILAAVAVLDVLMVALQPLLALTRPVGAAYRLRVFVEPGEMIETTVEAPDLASAAARAIRTIERGGRQVTSLEREKRPL